MTYVVGVAMLVAGFLCLQLGRRFLESAQQPSRAARIVGGDAFALLVTALLSGGLMTLLAEPLENFGAVSVVKLGLSLALVAAIVRLSRIVIRRVLRSSGRVAPA